MIIDTDANLVPDFEKIIERSGVTKYSTDYHIVSIIGAQSSGKSTFLNRVFGTNFKIMDDSLGRQQTTKGINCGMAVSSPIFLIDPEGSDSRERGDSDALFERKSALFSIALSEVIIINMWETDIGRFNAGNIPLLQAAFDANVQLFSKYNETLTTIVFIIRDVSTKFKEPLFKQISNDMEEIWNDIHLPDNMKNSKITDFFTFHFETMRHMTIDPDGFQEDVNRIREKFSSDCYFPKNSTKIVPAKSLSDYIERIWTIVNTNKELNIPSQRLLISKMKCNESCQLVFNNFLLKVEKKKQANKLSRRYKEHYIKHALEDYKNLTWKYIDSCVEEGEKSLNDLMLKYLSPILIKEADQVCKNNIDDFIKNTKSYETVLTDQNKSWNRMARRRVKYRISKCKQEIEYDVKPSNLNWTYNLQDFTQTIHNIIDESRENVKIQTIEYLTDIINEQFETELSSLLRIPNYDVWNQADVLINKYSKELQNKVRDVFNHNGLEVPLISDKSFIDTCENVARDNSRFVVLKMKTVFDSYFMYDSETKLPRVWKYKDNINKVFEEARSKGLDVLNIFQIMLIEKRKIPLLSNDLIKNCKEKFQNIIIHEYEQAKSILTMCAAKTRIPSWSYCIAFIFGYDWLFWIITQPFISIFFFLFLIYLFMKKNNLLNPILSLLNGSLTQKSSKVEQPNKINMNSYIVDDKSPNKPLFNDSRRKSYKTYSVKSNTAFPSDYDTHDSFNSDFNQCLDCNKSKDCFSDNSFYDSMESS